MQPTAMRKARILAFQILFQRSHIGIVSAGEKFLFQSSSLKAEDKEFAKTLADNGWANLETVDETIKRYLKKTWKQDRLQPQLNTLLRIACAEMMFLPPGNPKLLINETLEICKIYCKPNSVKICNGILDSVLKRKP